MTRAARRGGGSAAPVQAHERRGRPREPLDRERILGAALRLIDEHGLAELSMRRLGAELGVQAMSLYRHVANKQDVVEGVRELIFDELARLRPAGAIPVGWEEGLLAVGRDFRRVCQEHPHALALFATDVDRAYVASATFYEPALRGMVDAGLSPDDAVAALRVVVRYVLSSELLKEAVTAGSRPLDPDERARVEREHPLVGRLVRSIDEREPESLVEPGLEMLVTGLRSRLMPA